MQADQLAEFGKPDALSVARDFLEDRKRPAQRLHAAALPLLGVIVNGGRTRLHQPGDRGLAWSGGLLAGLQFGSRFHVSSLHGNEPNSIRLSSPVNSMKLRCGRIRTYTTIAIDVQYYEK